MVIVKTAADPNIQTGKTMCAPRACMIPAEPKLAGNASAMPSKPTQKDCVKTRARIRQDGGRVGRVATAGQQEGDLILPQPQQRLGRRDGAKDVCPGYSSEPPHQPDEPHAVARYFGAIPDPGQTEVLQGRFIHDDRPGF